jgi:hypothetical protein
MKIRLPASIFVGSKDPFFDQETIELLIGGLTMAAFAVVLVLIQR